MLRYLLLALISSSALGSNLAIGVGLGFGVFDDLSVPYASGSYRGLDPRADGSFSRSDVTRRQGLELQASISGIQKVADSMAIRHEFYIVKLSGISGIEVENFTSASFDKIGFKSLSQTTFDAWPLIGLNAGIGVQRMDWRNISTGHLLDSVALIGGFVLGRFQYIQLEVEAEQSVLSRFAWDNHTFNLAPNTMKNIKVSDRRIETRMSYLRLKSLSFYLSASQQFTNVKFSNLQESYAQSGLQVNPFLNPEQSRALATLRYSFGLERRF